MLVIRQSDGDVIELIDVLAGTTIYVHVLHAYEGYAKIGVAAPDRIAVCRAGLDDETRDRIVEKRLSALTKSENESSITKRRPS